MSRSALRIFCFLAVALLFTSFNHAQQPAPSAKAEALTNAEVLKMVEAKLTDDLIISKIRASACNFDTSTDTILKLKSQGVSDGVIQAMVAAGAPPAQRSTPAAAPPDPNDPKSPHDPGIYWLPKEKRDKGMVQLEPSVYSEGKTGGMFKMAMTYGMSKAKWKAVVQNPRANLRISEPTPEFWFYFEEKSHGLSQSGPFSTSASSANEFTLAKMEQKGKERELVVGEMGVFGGSAGTRSGDTIPTDFQKVAPGIYKLVPTKPLPPGEYCFFYAGINMAMGMTGGKLFDFGIDRAQ